MALHDFKSQRLYVDAELQAGGTVPCADGQANYLRNVLRMDAGSELLTFNGRDGEWRARLELVGKRGCALELLEMVRPQVE